MQQRIRTYFIYSRRERRAAWLIVILIVIVLCVPHVMHVNTTASPDNEQLALWQSLMSRTDTSRMSAGSKLPDVKYAYDDDTKRFGEHHPYANNFVTSPVIPDAQFDPNNIDEKTWIELGLPAYVAQRIIKYRNKGGVFYSPEDVKKIYGFPEDIYSILVPFMYFTDSTQVVEKNDPNETLFSPAPTELNSCDKSSLMALGFTAGDAIRILRFRDQAGGFYDTQQLFGVYGLDAEHIEKALPWLSADKNSVIKINLNTVDSTTLANHIYISDVLAGSIVRYRQDTGKYYTVTELLKVKGMYPGLFEKLKPYLQI
jgi:DNA uptake protein ComE-like DNA-binding protein